MQVSFSGREARLFIEKWRYYFSKAELLRPHDDWSDPIDNEKYVKLAQVFENTRLDDTLHFKMTLSGRIGWYYGSNNELHEFDHDDCLLSKHIWNILNTYSLPPFAYEIYKADRLGFVIHDAYKTFIHIV